jgi:hypothetical protein
MVPRWPAEHLEELELDLDYTCLAEQAGFQFIKPSTCPSEHVEEVVSSLKVTRRELFAPLRGTRRGL